MKTVKNLSSGFAHGNKERSPHTLHWKRLVLRLLGHKVPMLVALAAGTVTSGRGRRRVHQA